MNGERGTFKESLKIQNALSSTVNTQESKISHMPFPMDTYEGCKLERAS
jgi:hypothetical protein